MSRVREATRNILGGFSLNHGWLQMVLHGVLKNSKARWAWWWRTVILATQEAKAGRSQTQRKSEQLSKSLSLARQCTPLT